MSTSQQNGYEKRIGIENAIREQPRWKNDVAQQSADAQGSEVDESLSESRLELTRMDRSVATESNRPMYPPPGLEDPNHVTEHPTALTTTITGHQNISRRPISGRRRALSQTSTAAHRSHLKTAPVGHWIWTQYQRAQMRQDFQRTSGQGHQDFPSRHHQKEKCWGPTDSSETMPGVPSEISDAAIESVNRNRMEIVIERERSHSSEEHHAGLLVGTWYYLIPDSSGALVSEVVDRKDLALLDIISPRLDPPTDTTMNSTVRRMTMCSWLAAAMKCIQSIFLLMSVSAFEKADAAEWKAIVDSGSVKVLDSEIANTIRKERPDRVINSRMVRRLKPQEAPFRNRKPSPDGVFWDTRILTLPTCSLTHPLHGQRAS